MIPAFFGICLNLSVVAKPRLKKHISVDQNSVIFDDDLGIFSLVVMNRIYPNIFGNFLSLQAVLGLAIPGLNG
jgi:hypothetical protein